MFTRMKPFMAAVATGPKSNRDLTPEEARRVMEMILSGEATPVQAGAFLIALRNKGESPEELAAFTQVFRAHAQLIHPKVEGLVDIGSPYDGRIDGWAVSPAASLVTAAAGVPVVMHGGDSLPPKHGLTAGRVLAGLGIATDPTPDQAILSIEEEGFAYLPQRRYLPVLAEMAEFREQVCLRTALNTVEKIYNPAGAPYHLLGLTHLPYLKRVEGAFRLLGYRRVLVVQGMEGTEDASTAHACRMVELHGEERREFRFDPKDCGLTPATPEDLGGADVETSVANTVRVLSRKDRGAVRDLVVLNAGLRLYLGGRAASIEEGIGKARGAIDSGAAWEKLERLRARSAAPA